LTGGDARARSPTQITRTGVADLKSAYVPAMNVNYDRDLDPLTVETEAIAASDYAVDGLYRRHARVWLKGGDSAGRIRGVNMSARTGVGRRQPPNGVKELIRTEEVRS
jgi:hypothetical protein